MALRTFTTGLMSAFAAEGFITPDIKAVSTDVPRVSIQLQAQHVHGSKGAPALNLSAMK